MKAPTQKGYRSLNLTVPWSEEGTDKILLLESKTGILLHSVGHDEHIHLYVAVKDLGRFGGLLNDLDT